MNMNNFSTGDGLGVLGSSRRSPADSLRRPVGFFFPTSAPAEVATQASARHLRRACSQIGAVRNVSHPAIGKGAALAPRRRLHQPRPMAA